MNIAAIDYSSLTESIDIYVSGCKPPHCKECHNSHLWDFDNGVSYSSSMIDTIKQYVEGYSLMIDKIMIYGGEPLEQKESDLKMMLYELKNIPLPKWLFTKYDIKDVPNYVKETCDYIKCGKFLPEKMTDDNVQYGVKIATSNQKVYKKGKDY